MTPSLIQKDLEGDSYHLEGDNGIKSVRVALAEDLTRTQRDDFIADLDEIVTSYKLQTPFEDVLDRLSAVRNPNKDNISWLESFLADKAEIQTTGISLVLKPETPAYKK